MLLGQAGPPAALELVAAALAAGVVGLVPLPAFLVVLAVADVPPCGARLPGALKSW